MIQDHLIVPWNSIQKGNKYHQIQDKQKKLVDPIPHISAQNYPQIGVAVQIEGDPRAPQIDVKNADPKPSKLECTWPIFSMEDWCWVKSVSIYPIPSMGLVYLPFLWYGHGYFQYNKHNMSLCPSYAMVTNRYIGDGHPTFNRNPYNWYINPYGIGLMSLSPIIWKCHES